ncbi:MAG: pyridoxamine 5'-phosphate oxidase [Marmoricola sp.]
MSIPVDTAKLSEALSDFGSGYLLSTSGDGRVKAVTVDPVATEAGLAVDGPGKGTATNIAANPQVTVLFWPREDHGYTLIVDGEASGDADHVDVVATGAVLHRPASHADGPVPADGCGNDCQRVE